MLSLGLSFAGPRNTGKVIAWVGTAMFGAFALGAPLGSALYAAYGFTAIALATIVAPLVTLLVVLPLKPVAPTTRARPAFGKVIGAVWLPGLGMAFSSIGFGATLAFVTLLFAERGWSPTWPGLTLFALAFIVMRSSFGHLPDRMAAPGSRWPAWSPRRRAWRSIWLAPWPALALAGATLTGLGYSLVYPGFGVEAVRRAPSESRGLATGAYTASIDLALGIAGPALGLVAVWGGMGSVFLASALLVLCAVPVAVRLLRTPSPS